MKTKMLAACMLAVITLGIYSCNWVSKSNKAPSLTGRWMVTEVNDIVKKGDGFFKGFDAGRERVEVSFITDSTFTLMSANKPTADTAIYHLSKDNNIIVKADNDSKYDTFAVKVFTDTLLQVSLDSVYIQLVKQP